MAFAIGGFWPTLTDTDHMLRSAEIAVKSAGLTAPHPNCGCIIARGPKVIAEGFLRAHGSKSAEIQAVEKARELAKGATAYINLEPYTSEAVEALREAGLSRLVVGLRNPMKGVKGKAIETLKSAGTSVDVLGEDTVERMEMEAALKACQAANEPLLYRSAHGVPFSVLAMTLDGKIAADSGGHMARNRVFEMRGRSDAVLVGGNTVRRDDPLLTTGQAGGHVPVRVVMSASLDLPEDAKLWDVSVAPTVVATAKGARRDFQRFLASRGVEVVEFDPLTPRAVMEYFCSHRGFMSVLWECGGGLSAPATAGGVIHKVVAFAAPKIIGGQRVPWPIGGLELVKMAEALNLADVSYERLEEDIVVRGYLHTIP